MTKPTRQAYMAAQPRFVEDAAALFGMWPAPEYDGMELVGFAWEYRGKTTLLPLKAAVGHRGMPQRLRPIFVPVG